MPHDIHLHAARFIARTLAIVASCAVTLACHDTNVSTATLRVLTRTTGVDRDADGYLVAIDQNAPVTLGDSSTHAWTAVPFGHHQVAIGGLAANCTLDGPGPVSVTLTPFGLDTVTFYVSCTARKLTFVSERTGRNQIYSIRSDGDSVTPLSDGTANDITPSWTTDGARIAFATDRGGNYEIYAMNADGSGIRSVTSAGGFNFFPAWSPDGTRIAFESARDGFLAIYVVNADGSGLTRLTADVAGDEHPTWSADGTRIAFASARTGTPQIYTMSPDGTDATPLTSSTDPATAPVYSPDGTRIAYVVAPSTGNARIHVMAADGSGDVTVTDGTDWSSIPAWSPDGGKLAFMAQRDGAWQVFTIGVNGALLTQLTSGSGTNVYPAWRTGAP
jgi:TolB protein